MAGDQEADDLQGLLAELPALTWTTDLALRFQRPPAARYCGGPDAQAGLPGTHVADFFGEAAAEEHAAALAGEQAVFDFERDGRHYQGELRARVDGASAVTGVVGVALDTTAREALDQQRWDAAKMDVIGRLAGGMAHDFNNVLTIIVSYAQFLLDRFEPGTEPHEDAEIIHGAAKRAGGLISKLLTFSRRQVTKPVPTALNGLIEELEPTLRERLGEAIELTVTLDPALGQVRVDPQHFDQAVIHLATNAREAMPEGGKLYIETRRVDVDRAQARHHVGVVPGRYAVLSVSDTGVGMAAEVRAKAFEPFFSTKSKGKGTGLGLASVYGVVRQAGGNVWVYSEPGQGSTFKVYLPELQAESAATSEPAPNTGAGQGGHESILLVDDDERMRRGAVRALRTHGYTVHEADSGERALELCRDIPGIELLLTDVIMPGQSGAQLQRRVQQLRPQMRTLFMSGHTEQAAAAYGVRPGQDGFLAKPFSADTLLDKVRRALSPAD